MERRGEFPKTLFYWRVVQSFTPHDQEVSGKVLFWETRIRKEAENHFSKGLENFKQNSAQEARKEFLIALAYNPEHHQALDYLKHKLNEPVWTIYEVKKGDNMKKISQEIYKDPEKDFLIAYFNPLDSRDPLRPGMTLKLPILPPAWMDKKVPSEERLHKAPVPSKPLKLDASLQEQADVHYAKGIKYFLSEELEKAIEQWEETLRINPNHPNAKRDLQRARNLLKNLRKLP
ncbi:MAG: tetratricopeptide repeat protein [Deltaproteobacteria bacterium]|nr:tetratricopeptide repeat protein [Deltaproteobacteria bacterium]